MTVGDETQPAAPSTDGQALILYRLTQIERKLDSTMADHERRISQLEQGQIRITERLTIWQIGQGVYASVAALAAALVSRLR